MCFDSIVRFSFLKADSSSFKVPESAYLKQLPKLVKIIYFPKKFFKYSIKSLLHRICSARLFYCYLFPSDGAFGRNLLANKLMETVAKATTLIELSGMIIAATIGDKLP